MRQQKHNSSSMLKSLGISQKAIWDRGDTLVVKFTCSDPELQLLDGEMAEAPSVVVKTWSVERVVNAGGNQQVGDA